MENTEFMNKYGSKFYFCAMAPKDDKQGKMYCMNTRDQDKVVELNYMRVVDGKNCR